MSLRSRVAWNEGTLLLPQHFQQQDRFFEAALEARVGPLRPYAWGLTRLELNTDLDGQGKFGARACAGVLPDGTPFRFPDGEAHPAALELPANASRAIVYLSLPHRQDDVVEFGKADAINGARYALGSVQPVDTFGGGPAAERIDIGGLALSYEVEDARGLTDTRARVALARVIELRDGRVVLDGDFIPTVLDINASPVLARWLDAITESANRRIDELSRRAVDGASGRSNGPLLTLQLLNRWHPLLQHLRGREMVHPEELFGVLLQLAGELATHTTPQRRLVDPPTYRHKDLTATFEPLVRRLNDMLAYIFIDNVRQLRLEELEQGRRYVAPIQDRSVFERDRLVLAVFAPHRRAAVRNDFASLAKLAPVEKIEIARDQAVYAIPLRVLEGAPEGVHPQEDYIYFDLVRDKEWEGLLGSPGLAIYIPGQWPGLKLELWAIRKS